MIKIDDLRYQKYIIKYTEIACLKNFRKNLILKVKNVLLEL